METTKIANFLFLNSLRLADDRRDENWNLLDHIKKVH
jgi:hypothetical protein